MKRLRDNFSEPTHNSTMPNNNSNIGFHKLFFKTRLCHKFMSGSCHYRDSCTFAHGNGELRMAPSNWKDITRRKDDDWTSKNSFGVCHKYMRGLGCPRGDRCTYAHPKLPPSAMQGGPNERLVMAIGGDRGENVKVCYVWKATGRCPYGDECQFVHLIRDPPKYRNGQANVEHVHAAVAPQSTPVSDALRSNAEVTPHMSKAKEKKPFLIKKGHKKLVGIYADWIEEDLP
ncbi:Zinc finger CCCH domain-containing protein 13 [Acorus gramineus]|uniref:Zinc finger CCCH domain-containing protein 13 n=1 Tax=Acorus gramineus TaxID=55184 RepID=A0AAV9AMH9_ACOGR|nr:Zinc finger CCCH domain-containing protein 13 [Acorus gramineus]